MFDRQLSVENGVKIRQRRNARKPVERFFAKYLQTRIATRRIEKKRKEIEINIRDNASAIRKIVNITLTSFPCSSPGRPDLFCTLCVEK